MQNPSGKVVKDLTEWNRPHLSSYIANQLQSTALGKALKELVGGLKMHWQRVLDRK